MNWKKIEKHLWDYAIYVVFLLLILTIIILRPDFLSTNNMWNILKQSSTKMIISLGVAGIIITQGTDLSAGRQVGLAALISASLLQASDTLVRYYPNLNDLPIVLVIAGVMLVTAFVSSINGFVVAKLKVTPFIATLGLMTIVFGINNIYFESNPNGSVPISGLRSDFMNLATGEILGIPIITLIALLVVVIIYVLWNHTKFGKNMYAVGGNPEAATVSGVNVAVTIIVVYMLAGALYGLAGSLEAARVTSVNSAMGNMYELDAIAAAVVGGVSFSGGIGKVQGVVIGVLIFSVISYGLTYIGVTPYMQMIIKGLIIIVAVAIDTKKLTKKS